MSVETFHEFCVSQVRRLSASIFQTGVDPAAALSEIREQIEAKLSRGEREFVRRLIDSCLATSRHCPTVSDLYQVAGQMREREDRAQQPTMEDWRRQYGNPQPFKLGIDPENTRRVRAEYQACMDKLHKRFRIGQLQDGRRIDWPDWKTMGEAAVEIGYEDLGKTWIRSVKW